MGVADHARLLNESASDAAATALLRGAAPASNVFEATVERLGQSIKLGLFKPGQQVPPEREMAEIIGVSRVTVRAAIQVLVAGGFLTVTRGRSGGTFVAEAPPVWRQGSGQAPARKPINLAAFLDRRFVLETGICELAAQRISKEQARALEARISQLDALQGDLTEFRKADAQLHIALAEVTGNFELVRLSAELQAELNVLIGHLPPSTEALAHSNLQHARVLAAIAKHDGAAARVAMAEHLQGTALFLRGLLPGDES
jgi:GntR family transcriptional regulator, transcriptional repressor for pyruvate dehydrogenase complex